jgi:enamine deaminase RidA (YjgF/YER057c/UK114 family)
MPSQITRQTTRRGVLKNAVTTAAAVVLPATAQAQTSKPEKKAYPARPVSDGGPAPLFSSSISFGNLVFLAGIGYHEKATIEEATKHVLDELEKNLVAAGSSMEKVLKVNVYLNDIADWARMNTAYAGRWGKVPPVRTTVAPAGGIPGNSLVEIDCIAHL